MVAIAKIKGDSLVAKLLTCLQRYTAEPDILLQKYFRQEELRRKRDRERRRRK